MVTNLSRRELLRLQAACLPALVLSACTNIGGPRLPPLPPGEAQAYSHSPEMMAIGDSLFQGNRSLSMAPDMVNLSPPALISKKIGVQSFVVPEYPYAIGWNVEDIYKNKYPIVYEISAFGRNLLTNLQSWDHLSFWNKRRPWSRHEAFDNIAIGGATISDLWERHAGMADERLRKTLADPRVEQFQSVPADAYADAWFDLNTSLTLNPSRRDEQFGKSQLQQVLDRKPTYLFINIGSNDGLFEACFQGKLDPPKFDASVYEAHIDELFERLAELSPKTEKIIFNSLIRPRTVPNLMPARDKSNSPPGDAYFDGYSANLFTERVSVTGKQLQEFDLVVQRANEYARIALEKRLKDRGIFVDFFEASSTFDSKHYVGRGIPARGRVLTNTPIEFNPNGSVSAGGLAGLDNMHPTGPGYGVYANTILKAMDARNPLVDIDWCYDNDRLMTRPARRTYRRAKEVRQLVDLAATLSRIV